MGTALPCGLLSDLITLNIAFHRIKWLCELLHSLRTLRSVR